MNISVVIDSARRFLSDSDATNKRWLDADFFVYGEDAEREIIRLRPGLLLDPAATTDTLRTYTGGYTATTDPMFFDEKWKNMISDYMCYKALSQDNSDTRNAKISIECLARFEQAVVGRAS